MALQELEVEFGHHGFVLWSDPQGFYGERFDRQMPDVRQSVHPAINVLQKGVQFDSPYISVRLDQLEHLIAQADRIDVQLRGNDASVRSTIGFHLKWNSGLFRAFRDCELLKTEKQIHKFAPIFVRKVMESAKQFWARFSDAESVLKALLQNEREYESGTETMKLQKIIALELLMHGTERAREVAKERVNALINAHRIKTGNEVGRWATALLHDKLQ